MWEPLQKAGLCPPREAGEREGGSQVRLEVLCLEEWWEEAGWAGSLVLVGWEACKEEALAGEKVGEWEVLL